MQQQYGQLMDQPAGAESTVRPFRNKPGVLVVDDDHLVRIMVQLGLKRAGFEIWLAPTGQEAIDLFRAHSEDIDVALIDVRMPGLDGPQTLDALREIDPTILACFMCPSTGGHRPEEIRKRGAVNVIARPFQLDELMKIIRVLTQSIIFKESGELQGRLNNKANPHKTCNFPV